MRLRGCPASARRCISWSHISFFQQTCGPFCHLVPSSLSLLSASLLSHFIREGDLYEQAVQERIDRYEVAGFSFDPLRPLPLSPSLVSLPSSSHLAGYAIAACFYHLMPDCLCISYGYSYISPNVALNLDFCVLSELMTCLELRLYLIHTRIV